MKILAVDIGTGTQDVLIFDSNREPENAFKLVMPSPTSRVARAIQAATLAGEDLLLTGVMMGGGPCTWAAEAHLSAGFRVFATATAARTFNDDLDQVAAMGVAIVSEQEAAHLEMRRLPMLDYDHDALRRAFGAFDVDLEEIDVVAVAVFDHGAAPPSVSDRLFRFDYLRNIILGGGGLAGFAFSRGEIPASMTRLQSVAATAPQGRPLVVMDTAPAAVLGALEDPVVRRHEETLVVNIGNMHTLAFHLRKGSVAGLFEHHTGLLDRERLEHLVQQLAAGTLSHEALYSEHGHGALILDPEPAQSYQLAITGPRRSMLEGSRLDPYPAVPHGDMMMAGCWGLVRACATALPWAAEEIERALGRHNG